MSLIGPGAKLPDRRNLRFGRTLAAAVAVLMQPAWLSRNIPCAERLRAPSAACPASRRPTHRAGTAQRAAASGPQGLRAMQGTVARAAQCHHHALPWHQLAKSLAGRASTAGITNTAATRPNPRAKCHLDPRDLFRRVEARIDHLDGPRASCLLNPRICRANLVRFSAARHLASPATYAHPMA